MKKNLCKLLLILAATSVAAHADTISFTIDNTPMVSASGDTITFDATVTNLTAATLYLNSDDVTVDAPLSYDDTDFWVNWPLSLDAGASTGSEALLTVTIPDGTAAGVYDGTFDLLGGPGDNDENLLGEASFQVNVTPEPATFGLMLMGLTGLLALGFAKQRA